MEEPFWFLNEKKQKDMIQEVCLLLLWIGICFP
jgi:hypothetical protein